MVGGCIHTIKDTLRDWLEVVFTLSKIQYVIGWRLYSHYRGCIHTIKDTVRDWFIRYVLYMYQILSIHNTIIKVTDMLTDKETETDKQLITYEGQMLISV